jgi:hypothetical protein
MKIAAYVCLLIAASPALAGDFGPWSFGMSAEQIKAVSSHGPYKSFSNGDLETYNGDFGGKKENIQFFLKENRLWRIGAYTYEGTDLTAATQAWIHTYQTLQSQYGPIETPGFSGATTESLAQSARAIVAAGRNAQMAPVTQPEGMFVFSSFDGTVHGAITLYTVRVLHDSAGAAQ